MRATPSGQVGFTVIELMVASTVSLILMLTLMSIVLQAVQTAEGMHARIMMNQEAREIFDILAFGGPKVGINNTTVTHDYSFGLRGRRNGALNGGWAEPGAQNAGAPGVLGALMAWDANGATRLYRFALSASEASANGLPSSGFYSQPINAIQMTCIADSQPVQGCTDANGTVAVTGRLQADPSVRVPPLARLVRLREVALQIFDPFSSLNKRASFSEVSGVYWTGFTMNVDQ